MKEAASTGRGFGTPISTNFEHCLGSVGHTRTKGKTNNGCGRKD